MPSTHVLRRACAAFAIAAVTVSVLVPSRPSEAVLVERVIASGTADFAGVQGARWRRVPFTSQVAGPATFRLTWTGSGSLRFNVQRNGTVIGGNTTTSGSPKSATITLAAGTAYDAAIWSTSGAGTFQLTITEDLPDTIAPSAPAALHAASVTVDTVALAWNPSTDDVAVTGYEVVRDGAVVAATTAPAFVDGGLMPSTTYSYAVVALDAAGNRSAASELLVVTTLDDGPPDTDPPSVPTAVRATDVGRTSVTIDWEPATDDRDVAGYRIAQGGAVVADVSAAPFTVLGLAASTEYSFTVSAYDAAGNESAASDAVVVTTADEEPPDTQSPSVPSALRATSVGAGSVALEWDPSSDDHGVAGYRVSSGGIQTGTTTSTSFVASSLVAGITYTFTVSAFDAAGNESAPSEALVVTTRDSSPNIIIINTDDQRADLLADMPKVRSWLVDQGTTFTNGSVSTPSCCPSRATLMSGRYIHNNGQYGQQTLGYDLNLTIQRWLHDAGYLTGHAGKFLHWLPLSQVPPHWDRWTYFKGGYSNVWMRFDNVTRQSSGYSTTITFDRALEYLDDFESRDDDRPFYLHLTPIAPQSPTTPDAPYVSATVSPFVTTPAHSETDRTDKPPFVRNRSTSVTSAQNTRTQMIRTLYSVDDQVDRLMRRLDVLGELDDTMVVYTSDNGYFFAEHGLTSKFLPYPESVRVPFVIRWPGRVAAGATDDRWVTHADIAPTVLAAAGVVQDDVAFDGRDILSGHDREVQYSEYFYDTDNGNNITTWAAIETDEYMYVEYYSTSRDRVTPTYREYYDKIADPYFLLNRLGDTTTANDPDVAALSALLASAKNCSGASCP